MLRRAARHATLMSNFAPGWIFLRFLHEKPFFRHEKAKSKGKGKHWEAEDGDQADTDMFNLFVANMFVLLGLHIINKNRRSVAIGGPMPQVEFRVLCGRLA